MIGKEINFTTYIRTVSKFLFGTNNTPDNPVQGKKLFIKLKNILGLKTKKITEDLSKEYFNNPENVLYDLNLFKDYIELNKKVNERSIINISVNNIERTRKIITKGGRKIGFYMYMQHVSKELFGTEGNDTKYAASVSYLKKVIGIIPISKEYFNDNSNISYDLGKFLKHTDFKSVLDLKFTQPSTNVKVKIKNGKEISWKTYLGQASKYFYGTSYTDKSNQPRFTYALNKLKEMYYDGEKSKKNS